VVGLFWSLVSARAASFQQVHRTAQLERSESQQVFYTAQLERSESQPQAMRALNWCLGASQRLRGKPFETWRHSLFFN